MVLTRTSCYGFCPGYSVTITGDGTVTFEGRHRTKVKGKASAKIDRAKLVELVQEFKKADFFNLADKYSWLSDSSLSQYDDGPTYWVEAQIPSHYFLMALPV